MVALYKLGRPYKALKPENVESYTKLVEALEGGSRMRGTLQAAISDHPWPPGNDAFIRRLLWRGHLVLDKTETEP